MIKEAQQEILRSVKKIQKIHPEGEAFFDALDEYIRNIATKKVYDALADMCSGKSLILSGGFGKVIANRIDAKKFPKFGGYILFEGGLRKGNSPEVIRETIITEAEAVFVDDTIYGGKTYRLIKEYLEKNTKVKLDRAVVVYDGCPDKRVNVDSIFRYYDFFHAIPNYKFPNKLL